MAPPVRSKGLPNDTFPSWPEGRWNLKSLTCTQNDREFVLFERRSSQKCHLAGLLQRKSKDHQPHLHLVSRSIEASESPDCSEAVPPFKVSTPDASLTELNLCLLAFARTKLRPLPDQNGTASSCLAFCSISWLCHRRTTLPILNIVHIFNWEGGRRPRNGSL